MKVGIPRALYYYRFFPFWQSFLQGIGFKVIVSDQTTKDILDYGVAKSVDGICLPVKVYIGHVENLIAKQVDMIFIPYLISVEKQEFICPKLMGLPDIVKSSIRKLPPLLSPTIDGRKGRRKIRRAVLDMGRQFAPKRIVMGAYRQAASKQQDYEKNLRSESIRLRDDSLTIAVLSHEYLVHDQFISMGILRHLRNFGCEVVMVENLDPLLFDQYNQEAEKRMFWTSGKRILGAAQELENQVDGIISLMSFACGTDSLTNDVLARYCQRNRIPYLLINLDEHSGHAGVSTRLDAFIDMLSRRKQIESNSSTYG